MTYEKETARILVEARWRLDFALRAAQEAVRDLEKAQGASPSDAAALLENVAALGETIESDAVNAQEAYYRLIRKVQAND